MPRLIAACLLVVFATLATADTFVCPDGCESAATTSSADQCNGSGACVFCTGAVVVVTAGVVLVPMFSVIAAPLEQGPRPSARPAADLDHPPRSVP